MSRRSSGGARRSRRRLATHLPQHGARHGSSETHHRGEEEEAGARRAPGWRLEGAYADFVTAMMALFIVLWLMSSDNHVKQAIAGYFNDPRGHSELPGTDRAGAAEALPLTRENMQELKRQIEKEISERPDLNALKKQIEITITPEGLRIELLEAKDGTFFNSGSATLNTNGHSLLTLLARELGGVPNRISIEGHTDAQRYADDSAYGNWELSSDRANAARRLMQHTGLRMGQISQVRGFADQQLRIPADPLDPSNRRISVIVNFVRHDAGEPRAHASSAAGMPAAGKPGAAG